MAYYVNLMAGATVAILWPRGDLEDRSLLVRMVEQKGWYHLGARWMWGTVLGQHYLFPHLYCIKEKNLPCLRLNCWWGGVYYMQPNLILIDTSVKKLIWTSGQIIDVNVYLSYPCFYSESGLYFLAPAKIRDDFSFWSRSRSDSFHCSKPDILGPQESHLAPGWFVFFYFGFLSPPFISSAVLRYYWHRF